MNPYSLLRTYMVASCLMIFSAGAMEHDQTRHDDDDKDSIEQIYTLLKPYSRVLNDNEEKSTPSSQNELPWTATTAFCTPSWICEGKKNRNQTSFENALLFLQATCLPFVGWGVGAIGSKAVNMLKQKFTTTPTFWTDSAVVGTGAAIVGFFALTNHIKKTYTDTHQENNQLLYNFGVQVHTTHYETYDQKRANGIAKLTGNKV